MITIVDYGLGNVLAFAAVYKKLNIPVAFARTAEELRRAVKIILPGVGAFDHAMSLLNRSGMREELDRKVLQERTPVLGVCVGMQILARTSEEGSCAGLEWIDGAVKKIDPASIGHATRLPHMGWNDVKPVRKSPLFDALESDARFYFLHSYYFHNNRGENALAVTDYGNRFSCAVNSLNIYGVQFHPEKSHHYGTQLLKNFAAL